MCLLTVQYVDSGIRSPQSIALNASAAGPDLNLVCDRVTQTFNKNVKIIVTTADDNSGMCLPVAGYKYVLETIIKSDYYYHKISPHTCICTLRCTRYTFDNIIIIIYLLLLVLLHETDL